MKTIILLLVLLFCWNAFAADAEYFDRLELALVLKANSPEGLRQRIESVQHIKALLEACDTQIRERLVPTNCFLFLELKNRLGLKYQNGRGYRYYNKVCEANAIASTQRYLDYVFKLPAKCRQLAVERIKLNRYKFEGTEIE
jgi:hypothetical protein